jgi:di/tricarboxylate transporter
MITFDLILVFVVIILILISLYWGLVGPSFTFVIGISILGFFGILTPSEILSGFANEQIAVVILLLLIGDIIRQTAVIEVVFDRMFKSAKTQRGFLSRMVLIIGSFSAILNNTPLVAVMMPYVDSWCKRKKIAPSKFLMPLSYAAILGGCVTLIGTSTNLIVNGMVQDQDIIPGLEPLRIFDFTPVGLAMLVIGYFYIVFVGNRFMPVRPVPLTNSIISNREFMVEARVRPGSHLIGISVEQAGFSGEKNFELVEIIREGLVMLDFEKDFIFSEGDLLIFSGDQDNIAEMINAKSGLLIPEVGMMTRRKKTEIIEIVISQNSSLIGKTVKTVNFRNKYDAAVIAIHRNGIRINEKLDTVMLRAGDILLLFTGDKFLSLSEITSDFYFISKVKGFVKLEWYKTAVLLGGLVLAIALASMHIIKLFMGLIAVLIATLALKITNPKDLSKSIDYNLAIIIVLSIALGTAMVKTGAANLVADTIINVFMPYGVMSLLFGIFLITALLAAYITAKAAAAIVFPISLTMAANLGMDPLPFILIVAFGSAANFMTPIGFQTNLMVYGPGGYTFNDFFKIGAPLTIIYMFVTVGILRLMYF